MSTVGHSQIRIRLYSVIGIVLIMTMGASVALAKKSPQEKRDKIDAMAQETLQRLFKEKPHAKKLYNQAYGYAVFKGTQSALLLSGGSGTGVAVNKATGKRVYMRMLSGGIGLGLGLQFLKTVFLFEDERTFNNFVNKGWDADTSASAVAATSGINADASFTNGLMVYQLTDKGLIAQASLKGTKYWRSKKLNRASQK